MSRQLPDGVRAVPTPSARRMPAVMDSWYAMTRPPRYSLGAISAMNTGVTPLVTPMARPMMTRPRMRTPTSRDA